MTVFDTDVFVEILAGNASFVERRAAIPPDQQAIAIVTVEEVLRRLHAIRRAEAGKGRITIQRAYELLGRTVSDFQRLTVLPYTAGCDSLFHDWRERKVRVSTHDLRIAAICCGHSAVLASRNRRDFERVPGLSVEFWD